MEDCIIFSIDLYMCLSLEKSLFLRLDTHLNNLKKVIIFDSDFCIDIMKNPKNIFIG